MGYFWQQMTKAAAATIADQGEEFDMNGVPLFGKVNTIEAETDVVDGGKKRDVSFDVVVTPAVAALIPEGAIITARGMTGKVTSKVHEGSQVRVLVGPENAWGNGTVPGL